MTQSKTVLATIGLVLLIGCAAGIFWFLYRDDGVEEDMLTPPDVPEEQVQHSVPLEDIIAGGPAKDGIPPIDAPNFLAPASVGDWLSDDEEGIAVSLNGMDRFYPFQILVWHEMVNDVYNGQRVLVTYAPLTHSVAVYDPRVDGKWVTFGTSGKVWNSNLVMYDRATESLWPQILGEAVVGDATGQTLTLLPSDVVTFGAWKNAFPNGQVLSRDTGVFREYGYDPYREYTNSPDITFPLTKEDTRLQPKDIILGVVVNGQAKAYPLNRLETQGTLEDTVQGKTLRFIYDRARGSVRVFDGEDRVPARMSFWFAWAAAYPETALLSTDGV